MTREEARFIQGWLFGVFSLLILSWFVWSPIYLSVTGHWDGYGPWPVVVACGGIVFGGLALALLIAVAISALIATLRDATK